jgi:signal transduction histidine kinase
MLAVTEEELQRLILDIHDGPVQKLFAVSSHLALLQAQLSDLAAPAQAALGPRLAQAAALVGESLSEIKHSLSTFRPAEFQRRTLDSVLQSLTMQHEALTGNRVTLQIDGVIPEVGLAVKIALYRVLQEALSNAFRHAGVQEHEVLLSGHAGRITLEVIDEGRGFAPPPLEGPGATEREEHIGLRGMRERVHLIGGQLQLISQPGQGTRVIVHVAACEP